jgi:CheY-like chemotaxis protein
MNDVQASWHVSDSATQQSITGARDNRTAAQGLAALVVDDHPAMLKMAAIMLRKIGYFVYTADDGVQALLNFSTTPCDLVLTDYEMPVINGYKLGIKIKSEHPEIRVVIMTGSSRAAVEGLMSDSGIDGWLFKPFKMVELTTILEQVGLSTNV